MMAQRSHRERPKRSGWQISWGAPRKNERLRKNWDEMEPRPPTWPEVAAGEAGAKDEIQKTQCGQLGVCIAGKPLEHHDEMKPDFLDSKTTFPH